MYVRVFLFVCYSLYVAALRRSESPFKEFFQVCKINVFRFILKQQQAKGPVPSEDEDADGLVSHAKW
jgi:hypothetical protein